MRRRDGLTRESCPNTSIPSIDLIGGRTIGELGGPSPQRTGADRWTGSMDAGDTIPGSATKRHRGDSMSTILIVANQTLPSAALASVVAQRIGSGATTFHVVVPATPPTGGGFTWDEDAARREAEGRLEAFIAGLRDQGATADGEIGDRDPVAAVRDASRSRDVGEVILSTLPVGVSRWLRQDIPSRLRAAVSSPVTVVEEQPAAAGG
jgi:hypothetical protein